MSQVDRSRLRSLTAQQLLAALIRDGFWLRLRSGSHRRYQHADARRVTVSFHHPGDTFRPKTLRSMIQDQARWSERDLRRLKILKQTGAEESTEGMNLRRLDPVHAHERPELIRLGGRTRTAAGRLSAAPAQPSCLGEPGARSSDGVARLEFRRRGAATDLARLFQQGSLRVLRPNVPAGEPACAVLLNTSGGIVGGDVLEIEARLAPGAAAMITTQAAEKVYRSAGALSTLDVRLALAADAWLEWLPQETILFDRARLRRRLVLDLAQSARLLAADLLVFGRRVRGERFQDGFFHDRWQVRLAGRLVWRLQPDDRGAGPESPGAKHAVRRRLKPRDCGPVPHRHQPTRGIHRCLDLDHRDAPPDSHQRNPAIPVATAPRVEHDCPGLRPGLARKPNVCGGWCG
jgi:predicted RNA binding protein YcfA (HicA-like mRNA interferase family)